VNILVLGGAGFLGSNLVRRCLQDPQNQILVVDSLEPQLGSTKKSLDEVWSSIHFVQGDMRDPALMREIVEGQDIIFNCAGQTSHPLSMSEPLFDASINCLGNLTLLEAIRERDREKETVVVYPSTSTVVGPAAMEFIDETDAEDPLDIYSANKGVAEKYYRIYHRVHELKTVVLRFANLYGPYGKGLPAFGFINYFIHLGWHGEDITVYGTGAQRRNVLYVEDAAEVLYRSAFNPRLVGKLHFAVHHEHLSALEIAHKIVSVFGRGRVVNVDWPDGRRRIDIGDVLISSAKLREVMDWQPRFSFEEGLMKTRETMEAMQ
jgi:UDP-glucose 4-epimerase